MAFVQMTCWQRARYPTRVKIRVEGNGQSFVAVDREFAAAKDLGHEIRRLQRDLRGRANLGREYRLVIGVPVENAAGRYREC